MAKDKRYATVKNLIEGGYINSFPGILETIKKTNVARDLGMHHQTFDKLLKSPERFAFKDAIRIASLIGVEDMVIIEMIYKYAMDKKNKRKK
jgi:plasmid maintenance system antidote protein VapI